MHLARTSSLLRLGGLLWLMALGAHAESAPARLPLLAQFDHNADGQLDAAERSEARAYLAAQPAAPAPATDASEPMPEFLSLEPAKGAEKITAVDAAHSPDAPLYDEATLRTVFLQFDDADWEAALTTFARTDVVVPARVTIDGRDYPDVGVRFRTPTADPLSPTGYKRSLELIPRQGDIAGASRLQLLDGRRDPTLLRTALYLRVARAYLPAPAANYVHVVINGESWGVFLNIQPFDEAFLAQHGRTEVRARWTVPPGGDLAYLGDAIGPYRAIYHLDTPNDPAAWLRLVQLCRTLHRTPDAELAAALEPLLDVEETLRFLALENTLINQQGYRGTAGGYGLYLDANDRFHFVPLDAEMSFHLLAQKEERDERSGPGERASSRREGRGVAGGGPGGGAPGGGGGGPGGGGPPSGDRGSDGKQGGPPDGAQRGQSDEDREKATVARYLKAQEHPRQVPTDLAMMLGYSLVARADHDLNMQVTREEWLEFARGWFFMMDESHPAEVSSEQFVASVRQLVTPRSLRDGKSTQTFGEDDAPALIGQDLFAAADTNQDTRLTRDEFLAACSGWFDAWRPKKRKQLVVDDVQTGLKTLLTRTDFQADQTRAVVVANASSTGSGRDGPRGGPGGGGPGGGGPGGGGEGGGASMGGGLSFGPLHMGMPRLGQGRREGRSGSAGGSAQPETYYAQLLPLENIGDESRPLLTKLLRVPELRTRYLQAMKTIVDDWLSWDRLGPIARRDHELIRDLVRRETHRPWTYQRFVQELDQDLPATDRAGDSANLRAFVTDRAAYLRRQPGIR